MEEISNNKLSKFLSIEIVGSMLITAFMVGVTWNSLAGDVSATDKKVSKVEVKHTELETSIQSIQVDVAVVKTNQEHLKDDIERQNTKLREQGQDIKQILRILQEVEK